MNRRHCHQPVQPSSHTLIATVAHKQRTQTMTATSEREKEGGLGKVSGRSDRVSSTARGG